MRSMPQGKGSELMDVVYFVGTDDRKYIKIGFSARLSERLVTLSYAPSPHGRKNNKLIGYLRGDRRRERQMHAKFAHLRCEGEWFRNEGALAKFISQAPLNSNVPKRQVRSIQVSRPIAQRMKQYAKNQGFFLSAVWERAAALLLESVGKPV